jgi:hypothetical protein
VTKECSWPGCARKVDDWRWGCGEHYRLLPADIQLAIRGGALNAQQLAEQWIRETFGGEIRERWDPGKWERLVRMIRDKDAIRRARRAAAPSDGS